MKFITYSQNDDKTKVLSQGKIVSFRLKSLPFALIETIKYRFEFYNTRSSAYSCDNMMELIDYIEIKNKNKQVEKIEK